MMAVSVVMDWLSSIPPDSSIGVDEGGLTLREVNNQGELTENYLDLGGIPEDIEG